MKDRDPKKVALESFAANRRESEKLVAVLEREIRQIEDHLKSKESLPWWAWVQLYRRGVKKLLLKEKKKEVAFENEYIAKYLKVEEGLLSGDYELAISTLEEIAENLLQQSGLYEVGFLGPRAIGKAMLRLKDELVLLQKKEAA